MNCNIILILAFSFGIDCMAQTMTLEGKVITEKDLLPVPFANIYVKDLESNSFMGTISDVEGNFSLKISSKYSNDTLKISCVGFESVAIALAGLNYKSNLILKLKESITQLQPIVIRELSAKEIVQRCIKAIQTNYLDISLINSGFYWQSSKEGGSYKNIEQAYFTMLENNSVTKVKRDLKIDPLSNHDSASVYHFLEQPENIFYFDLVRQGSGFIKPEEIDEWVFSYDVAISRPENYILVNATRRDKTASLKLWLDEENLAFEQIDYTYRWNADVSHFLNDTSFYQMGILEGKVLYKRNLTKYSLSYVSNSFTYSVFDKWTRRKEIDREVRNEFNISCAKEFLYNRNFGIEEINSSDLCKEMYVVDKLGFCEAACALGVPVSFCACLGYK